MAEPPLWIEIDPDLRDLVPRYLNRLKFDLEAGRDALRVGNFMALQKLGHNLCGSAGSFGFFALHHIANRLEQAAMAQNHKASGCALDDMHTFTERVKVVFRRK
jgi:HPt (histidine-containing phosphotransfer) domain-containing protein